MITYLIKSTLCFVVLFGFYKLALENKALHHFKRYYLLVSLIFSLSIPLVTFTYTSSKIQDEVWIEAFTEAFESSNTASFSETSASEKTNSLPYVLWIFYGIGVFLFGSRFITNLLRLKRKITTAEIHHRPDFSLALLPQVIIPHSFLQYIFLSKKPFQNKEIPAEVIAHEATHVRQKHSLDILFIEIVQVLFWFNPLFWIVKSSIKLNHEFLADQGALQTQNDLYQYQNILLDYASSAHHTTLESSFSYSSTKKRILMLSQTFSRKRAALTALFLLPVFIVCSLLFNNAIKAQEKKPIDKNSITQFMEGAERNGKKPLVIEVKNDQITLNGHPSAVARFQKDIDAITRDWEETDYTNAATSFLFKDNSKEFMERLEVAYAKTHISKANDGSKLFPPPPPPPPATPRPEDHLSKMNRLGGEFYFENKKITYDQAQKLIKEKPLLNINTPYPYSEPPQTFISRSEFTQDAKYKKGDTLTITVNDTGERHTVIIDEQEDNPLIKSVQQVLEIATIQEIKYTAQNPVSAQEIATYNRLAKKYNANPTGVIIQREVALMENIYSRMTPAQKKAAQSFPNLPPPPPPNPKDSLKSPQLALKTKKESAKGMFSLSNKYPNMDNLYYQPGYSLKQTGNAYQYSEIIKVSAPADILYYENGKLLSNKEALTKIASNDYFKDIKNPDEESDKLIIKLSKKPHSSFESIKNSQHNKNAQKTEIISPHQSSKSLSLKNKIEQHALSNGIFEINNTIVSKEKALQALDHPDISLEVRYLDNKPFKMILHSNNFADN